MEGNFFGCDPSNQVWEYITGEENVEEEMLEEATPWIEFPSRSCPRGQPPKVQGKRETRRANRAVKYRLTPDPPVRGPPFPEASGRGGPAESPCTAARFSPAGPVPARRQARALRAPAWATPAAPCGGQPVRGGLPDRGEAAGRRSQWRRRTAALAGGLGARAARKWPGGSSGSCELSLSGPPPGVTPWPALLWPVPEGSGGFCSEHSPQAARRGAETRGGRVCAERGLDPHGSRWHGFRYVSWRAGTGPVPLFSSPETPGGEVRVRNCNRLEDSPLPPRSVGTCPGPGTGVQLGAGAAGASP